jgi:site-specific recombinase
MVANFVVESAQGEHYITQEMKQYRDIGGEILNLPENAITAARAAVLKWGNSMGVAPGGH